MKIREANLQDAAAIARVRVDSWRTTYQGVLPEEYLASLSYEEYTHNWQMILSSGGNQGFTYVAEDDGGIVVGFAIGGPERTNHTTFTGEVYAIYLLKNYQRLGLGRKLVLAVVRRLVQEGLNSMLIWVLSVNPARSFYAGLGGQPMFEKHIFFNNSTFTEVAYVWPDIRPLAEVQEAP